jgi:hypothetical protein
MTPRQEKALAALLTEPTGERAGEAAGVNYIGLRRWLAEDAEFKAASLAARRRVLDAAVSRLQQAAGRTGRARLAELLIGKPTDQP